MDDQYFMRLAMEEALKAFKNNEVPVGAIVVIDNRIIASSSNQRENLQDATAHAEIIAIREACRRINNWRLKDAILYVTKEPCIMCAGAILNARIKRLVYGCDDPKGGAVKSLYRLLSDERLNHRVEVVGGVMEEECGRLLKDFFKTLREE